MCVCSARIIERLCVEIDGFSVCVMLEIVERVYSEIDGFNVCVLLKLSDNWYAGIVIACEVCVHAKM